MNVETYDLRELDSATLDYEPEEDALELIAEMGLEGQLGMVKDDAPVGAMLARYGRLTDQQAIVCYILFPKVSRIEQYAEGPIPLRVLKEAHLAREQFDHLYILHAPPVTVVDPILVGSNESFNEWNRRSALQKFCLIARWGDALDDWSTLYAKAVATYVEKTTARLRGMISQINVEMSRMEAGEQPTELYDFPDLQGMPFIR